MSLEQFLPKLKQRCSDCGGDLTGQPIYYVGKETYPKKPLCRGCARKRLGGRLPGEDSNEP